MLFSSILYLCIGPFFHNTLPATWLAHKAGDTTSFTFEFNAEYLAFLVLGVAILSLVYGTVLNRDWLYKLLRWFKLTEKTSRLSVWNDALQDIQSRYLLVELGDQRTVVGFLRYYSDDVEQASIFLQDAAWLADGVQIPIDGPGILLTKEAEIISISFLDPVVTDAIP